MWFLSIILGLLIGLALGFVARCFSNVVYKGPSSSSIQKQIFSSNGKCYRLHPIPHVCPPSIDTTLLDHSSDEMESDDTE